ncbi:AcrR family transcriptional regulator [Actinoplanes octamycinicus]|uniref:AcrR family transcriptional regulator n=1 Tax=Actinoplanes octamycinicus TaxID=135948 RepID=A0A7W7M8L2_9ACTN|nr:TetR/AcrR family transcriptional regulator [Actinoplanes octamycinicus]MBB4740926.1 AcrR family transcriptional regulator [Actinoplanes octamycinicus]GIE55833.1 TetR family transcriptional regulator [Actinoplanes octamycinicus]
MVLEVNEARDRVLDAAEELIYARGIRAVGMDDVRTRSGVALKRLYALYPSKDALVEAVLERRDGWWRGRLAAFVERVDDPVERVLAVFDWLGGWFAEPGFRGCAWINAFGEAGATSPAVAAQVERHKRAFAGQLAGWVAAAGRPPELAEQLFLLAEGAMVTAGIRGSAEPASTARQAAAALMV